MTDVAQSLEAAPQLAGMLVRVQQVVLAAGYRYVAGNLEEWPLTQVLLRRGSDLLYVCPFRPEQADEDARIWDAARRKGGTSAGLLLVGTLDLDDPAVRQFYGSTRGTVAYIDAAGGTFTLRRSWNTGTLLRSLTKHNLRKFLRPEQDRKSQAIDCRARLQSTLEEQEQVTEFFQQARRTGQISGPALTYVMLAGLAGVFVAMVAACREWKAVLDPPLKVLMDWGALYGPAVRAGQWWRIFTCGAIHIGLIHLVFNLWALYIFGMVLETLQGRWRMGIILVWSVVCGAIARLSWDPMIVSAGASGGIFGLIGALLAVVLRYRKSFPPTLAKSYRKWVVTILVYNAVFLIDPRIDGVAHAGGFLGGLVMGLVLCRSPVRVSWPSFWTWPALAAMVLGACLAGRNAIARIPTASFEIIEARDLRERRGALEEFGRQIQTFGQGPGDLQRAFSSTWTTTSPSDRKRILETIRSEILPSVRDPNSSARLRDLAARAQFEGHPLMDPLDALLAARKEYCTAVAEALERTPNTQDLVKASDLWLKATFAQAGMTGAILSARFALKED